MSGDLCPDCGQPRPVGAWPICQDASGKHGHLYSRGGNLIQAIHTSERAAIFRGPKGEIRYPMRNDQPMPAQYAREGFVREEIDTHQKRRELESSTGRIQERAHYDPGSATAERDFHSLTEDKGPKMSEDLKRSLIQAIR